jgi:hypothetical protein
MALLNDTQLFSCTFSTNRKIKTTAELQSFEKAMKTLFCEKLCKPKHALKVFGDAPIFQHFAVQVGEKMKKGHVFAKIKIEKDKIDDLQLLFARFNVWVKKHYPCECCGLQLRYLNGLG